MRLLNDSIVHALDTWTQYYMPGIDHTHEQDHMIDPNDVNLIVPAGPLGPVPDFHAQDLLEEQRRREAEAEILKKQQELIDSLKAQIDAIAVDAMKKRLREEQLRRQEEEAQKIREEQERAR